MTSRLIRAFICTVLIFFSPVLAQQTQVSWSSFNSGFGTSTSTTTKVQSQFGVPVIGSNQQSNTAVGSGFLANPIVFEAPCNYSCIRVYVEGPMNIVSGLMDNVLKANGILASHFPGIPIPAVAVDSIAIELRNAAANPTTRKIRPAWLLNDGTIRAFNDTSDHYVEFDTLPGNYYLAIHHRNHLAIMTSSVQALMGVVPPAYDFTLSQSQAHGTNPMKLVGTKYCLYAGDADENGGIGASDLVDERTAIGVLGYDNNDVDMNGGVGASDLVLSRNNIGQVTFVTASTIAKQFKKKER